MKDLINNAEQLDRKAIKLTFKADMIRDHSNTVNWFTCEVNSVENHRYSIDLYSPYKEHLESMRDNVLFGLNKREKLEAENEALRNKADRLQNEIDNLKQR